MAINENIINLLFEQQDNDYRLFQSKLIPTIELNSIIGVRTPVLRALAKDLSKHSDIDLFLSELPHQYFDENQLHAFIISLYKDYDKAIEEVCRFLPYINNWATCDQLSPKVFKKNKLKLLTHISKWVESNDTYTVRFAVSMLMEHFLDNDFKDDYLKMAASIRSDEYYINMMTAWYFSTALAKQYESVLPYIENRALDPWTQNKAIQKAIESRRISPDQKDYLKSLKIKLK